MILLFGDQNECFRLDCQSKCGTIQNQMENLIGKKKQILHTNSCHHIRYFRHFSFRLIEKHKDTFDKQNVVKLTKQLKEQNSDKNVIIKELKTLLECDDSESSELYYNHINNITELDRAKENAKYLLKISVSRSVIKKHGSLLTLPFGRLLHSFLSTKNSSWLA